MEPLVSELVGIDAVQPFPGNPRRGDVEAIKRSLLAFGQTRPIIVQRSSGFIVGGNHVWRAAKALGWDQLNVVYLDINDGTARRLLVADNRMSELGENDPDALAHWLAALVNDGLIDDALGYASEDIDRMLRSIGEQQPDDDVVPPLPREPWVKPGDLFAIGRHRLLCGDSTQLTTLERLMGERVANMVWTDPPYGVDYVGGTAEHLTIANDAPDEVALRALLDAVFTHTLVFLKPGGSLYCAAPGGDRSTVFVGALKALGVYRQTIIWVKDALVLGRQDYHWRHEPVHLGVKDSKDLPVGRKGKPVAKVSSNLHYGWRPGAAHYFVSDRSLDTVWEIPRPRSSREHPTMKPVELVERCVLASSRRGDVVLDPFAGSGTTLVACERTARSGMACELDPRYTQVILERMERLFDLKAVKL